MIIPALDVLARLPAERVLQVSYENLVAEPRQGLLRLARFAARAATVPATLATGFRTAIDLVRARQPGLLGAPLWWAFDIAVLWACFHAFGANPPRTAVIVMAYYVGTLANALPLPGGIGGVEGGMIGAFLAFGVPDEGDRQVGPD